MKLSSSSLITLLLFFLLSLFEVNGQTDEPYSACDRPAVFEGCEDLSDIPSEIKCTNASLIRWINEHLDGDKAMEKSKFQGTVYAQFMVNKEGYISEVDVLKSPHTKLSSAAKKVISTIPRFTPAEHMGTAVDFLFTVPIRFKNPDLEKKEVPKQNRKYFTGLIWPTFPQCEEEQLEDIEKCFMTQMGESLKTNLVYPDVSLLKKVEGNILLEFTVEATGLIGDIEVLEGTDEDLIQAAKEAVLATPQLIPAAFAGESTPFSVQAPVSFEREKWLSDPLNFYDFHENYYSVVLNGLEADSLGETEVKNTSGYSELVRHVTNSFREVAFSKGWSKVELAGHVFTKYSIDSSGAIKPYDYIFENTTALPDRAVNGILSSISVLPDMENHVSNGFYELTVYFSPPPYLSDLESVRDSSFMPAVLNRCEALKTNEERTKCTETEILIAIAQNTVMPDSFLNSGAKSARVFVEFIVGKTGYVQNIKIVECEHDVLIEPSLNAIKNIPHMFPFYRNGEPLLAKYTVPVNFVVR